MRFDLSGEERLALEDALSTLIADLRMEIGRAREEGRRQELTVRRRILDRVLASLQSDRPTAPSSSAKSPAD